LPFLQDEFAAAARGEEEPPRFACLSQYEAHVLQLVPTEVRVYRAPGLPEIVVPEEYAARLERYQQLAKDALRRNSIGNDALRELSDPQYQGLRARLTPERLAAYLRSMPEPRYFDRVHLSGAANPYDMYYRARHARAGFQQSTMDSVFDTGETSLYARNDSGCVTEDLLHEWSHHLERRRPIETRMFQLASSLEAGQWGPRPYADDPHEQWAVLVGEHALHPDGTRSLALLQEAPLRAAVIGETLKRVLEEVSEAERGPYHGSYMERAELLCNEARSIAQCILLESAAQNPGTTAADQAVKLLCYIGTEGQVSGLSGIRSLDLSYELITNRELVKIAPIPQLHDLSLSHTYISNDGVHELRGTPLTRLSLVDCRLTDYAMPGLPTTLTVLDLRGTNISDDSISVLGEHKLLAELDISGTAISDEGAARLRRLLPNTKIVF
jgi:hypothetical protein